MKVKGFLKDVTGASRVTKARRNLIASGESRNIYSDPIREVAKEVHPDPMKVVCVSVNDASPTARTFRFKAVDGTLPPFEAGQYVSFELQVGTSLRRKSLLMKNGPGRTGCS